MRHAPITIASPSSVRPWVLFAVFAPLALLGFGMTLVADRAMAEGLFFVFVLALFASAALLERSNRKRKVVLDIHREIVTVKDTAFFFLHREREYAMAQFTSVVSYFTPDRYPMNRVELLVSNGQDGLVLLTTPPLRQRTGFFQPRRITEHPALGQARDVVSKTLSVANMGFAGFRKTGPQVRPNAA